MEVVRARFRRHVDHAAAGASHLRVVGVHLDFHFLHGFHARIRRGTVLQVGHRESVHEVVVRAHGAAAHRDGGVADLILHAVPVRVAAGLHGRLEVRQQEQAASRRRNRFERLRVDDAAGRRVRVVDERRFADDRDRLFNRPDLELDVEREELLRIDAHAGPLERAVAGDDCHDFVRSRIDRGERVLAGCVRHGVARNLGLLVDEHHDDAGDHAAGILGGSTQTALKRLRIDVAGDDAYEQHRRKKRQKPTGSHKSS